MTEPPTVTRALTHEHRAVRHNIVAPSRRPSQRGDQRRAGDLLLVRDLPLPALQHLLRLHSLWLVIAGGCAMVALVIPSTPWYVMILRLVLGVLALAIGTVRLLQINGITAELTHRGRRDTRS